MHCWCHRSVTLVKIGGTGTTVGHVTCRLIFGTGTTRFPVPSVVDILRSAQCVNTKALSRQFPLLWYRSVHPLSARLHQSGAILSYQPLWCIPLRVCWSSATDQHHSLLETSRISVYDTHHTGPASLSL